MIQSSIDLDSHQELNPVNNNSNDSNSNDGDNDNSKCDDDGLDSDIVMIDQNDIEMMKSSSFAYTSMVTCSDDTSDAGFVSSVLTADGIHDVPGYCVVCLVIFIGDMARGIFFPSLWPLVKTLDGTHVVLGYAVASFSFGRLLVNPIFGSWSIAYGYSKTLFFSCSVLLLGTFFYAQVQNVGKPQFLIIAQTMLGIGSGTLGVTRAYIADITAKRSRTTYISWATALQYAGFTMSPFFGALFNKQFENIDWQYGFIRINMYTVPAYFLAVCIIFTLIIISIFFQNRDRIEVAKDVPINDNNIDAPKKQLSKRRQRIQDVSDEKVLGTNVTVYDFCLLGCLFLQIAPEGAIAIYETLGVSYAQSNFGLTSSGAGFIVSVCGSFGVLSLLSMGYITYKYKTSDVVLITFGFISMVIGTLSLIIGIGSNNSDDGSDGPQSWRYMIAIFLVYSSGFPVGQTAVIGLFSKLVGRRPQGTMLGCFVSSGSLARMIFPVLTGYIVQYKDYRTVFVMVIVMLVLSIILVTYNMRNFALLSS